MTSDLERMVHDRLHAELRQLVPDDLSPATNRAAGGPQARTAYSAQPARRGRHWRFPLLAAAAVAAIALAAVPLLRHPDAPAPQPDPAAVAASRSYIAVGTPMTPLAQDRAVKLLTSWDQAAPRQPEPINFGPDNSHLSGTAAGQGVSSIHVKGAVLTVEFVGGNIPKNHDCGYDYTVSALASTRAVAVFTNADPGTWPSGPDVPCAFVAASKTATITLTKPLGSRSLLDVTTGSVIVPTP